MNYFEVQDTSIEYVSEYIDLDSSSSTEEEDEHLNVYLRIKGLITDMRLYDIKDNDLLCKMPDSTHSMNMIATYHFSKIFGPETSQMEIFNSIIRTKVLDFINGRNSTILTYGTSGSGKTYTIVGTADQPGIIPRALEYIFRSLPDLSERPEIKPQPNGEILFLNEENYQLLKQKKRNILATTIRDRHTHVGTYRIMQQRLSSEEIAVLDVLDDLSISVWVSFAEIYNEHIYDLLENYPNKNQRKKLKLGSSKDDVFIRDLSSINVVDGIEAFQMLQYGLHNLNYASTGLNSHSSRSHGIFTIKLVQYLRSTKSTRISSFNFCDLAGSERLKKTLNVGERLKESNNINKSLHVLGRCIKSVRSSQKSKNPGIIPFRESKLTQLFQNALMGNENISIIINLNPSSSMFEESRHALNFSALSKDIIIQERPVQVCKVKNRFSEIIENEILGVDNVKEGPNIVDDEKERMQSMIMQLSNEIEQLKAEKDEEIFEEKMYVKELYEKLMKNSAQRAKELHEREKQRLREKYEDKIRDLERRIQSFEENNRVINISSSSSENSFSEDRNHIGEIERLQAENEILRNELDSVRKTKNSLELENEVLRKELDSERTVKNTLDMENRKMQQSILEKDELISNLRRKPSHAELDNLMDIKKERDELKQEVRENNLIIMDAKEYCRALEKDNNDLRSRAQILFAENFRLKAEKEEITMCTTCSSSSDDDDDGPSVTHCKKNGNVQTITEEVVKNHELIDTVLNEVQPKNEVVCKDEPSPEDLVLFDSGEPRITASSSNILSPEGKSLPQNYSPEERSFWSRHSLKLATQTGTE